MSNSTTSFQLSLKDGFTKALACAAISPGLRNILVFDSTAEELQLTAQTIAQMLEVVTGYGIVSVTLGTYETEDDLWGSLGLGGESEDKPFAWKPGLLTAGYQDCQMRLVVIPDLTKLSLSAARACVVLMGADVAHLERHGQQEYWQPNLCWLAGCASGEVGMVSPHLLDRFTLRLSGQVIKTIDRAGELLEWINESKLGKKTQPEPLPSEISLHLQNAVQNHPVITEQAIARIIDYTCELEVFQKYSPRRGIALGRLSLASARLESAAEMEADHVDAAARMFGLKPVAKKQTEEPTNPTLDPELFTKPPLETFPPETTFQPSNIPDFPSQIDKIQETVYKVDEPELLPPTPINIRSSVNPYPEDEAPVEREAASLQFPTRRFRSKTKVNGPIIGVHKAMTFQDLALVRTLLEATKFQQIRPQSTANGSRRLILSPTDLHCYRRAPVAEQMLMLVLDHTCLHDCNWQEELLPYLSWAYVERATELTPRINPGGSNSLREFRLPEGGSDSSRAIGLRKIHSIPHK